MKVILTKDVKKIGRAHEQVEVSDGYALNFLIPQKAAISATSGAQKEAKLRHAQASERGDIAAKLVMERLSALAETPLTVQKKANEKGHLYDALDAKEIAALAELPIEAIALPKPIKELGTFDIPVAFGAEFGKISVTIEAE